MDEKEAELRQRFEDQKQDVRPGSLDTWGEDLSHQLAEQPQILESSFTMGHETLGRKEAQTQRRLARDAELGKDFFS